jgi:hypothetical protein
MVIDKKIDQKALCFKFRGKSAHVLLFGVILVQFFHLSRAMESNNDGRWNVKCAEMEIEPTFTRLD